MNKNHWLMRAKQQAKRECFSGNVINYFQQGSVAWRHFTDFQTDEQENRAIRNAQKQGYLTENTGIPMLKKSI